MSWPAPSRRPGVWASLRLWLADAGPSVFVYIASFAVIAHGCSRGSARPPEAPVRVTAEAPAPVDPTPAGEPRALLAWRDADRTPPAAAPSPSATPAREPPVPEVASAPSAIRKPEIEPEDVPERVVLAPDALLPKPATLTEPDPVPPRPVVVPIAKAPDPRPEPIAESAKSAPPKAIPPAPVPRVAVVAPPAPPAPAPEAPIASEASDPEPALEPEPTRAPAPAPEREPAPPVASVAPVPTAAPPPPPAPATKPVKRIDRKKRPTPMSPQEATRHISFAWEQLTGEPATLELVSVLWAQWALETGRGRWMVDYNYAGLKGRAPDGGLAQWWTWEETDDGPRRVRAKFRSYETAEEGARDYVKLLRARYPRAVAAARRGDAISFVLELDDGGFFSERPSHYVSSVASLAQEFRREHRAARF